MRYVTKLRFAFLILICAHLSSPARGQSIHAEESVVKVVNQYNQFNWYTPWASGSTGKGTGSGFVISKNRIMTNAHVVSDSALILVYFHNDPQPYPARVTAIAHDCDLAILELEDPARIKDVPALSFDNLPKLRSQVVTYGYPAGGKLISSTAGVVSRIEIQLYSHSGTDQYLAIQTDAAINPGNSGGPVLQNGKVVGVAFQGNTSLENMGFFIPVLIIDHFLNDLEDGKYDGFPYIGLLGANLENPAARAYFGMTTEETGFRIDHISEGSSAAKLLQLDDIITEVEGYDVANDGSINWNGLRLYCMFLSDLKQKGETLKMKIIRGKDRLPIELRLDHYDPSHATSHLYDVRPNYFVYAGLVFAPLNRETLKSYSQNWSVEAPQELVYEAYYRHLFEQGKPDDPQLIQIRRLDHQVNVEEASNLYSVIESVNGLAVRTLPELIAAFEGNQEDQHLIRYRYGNRITVLDRKKADAANAQILKQYTVPKDRNL
jgi:S1-C subfamily serine protease